MQESSINGISGSGNGRRGGGGGSRSSSSKYRHHRGARQRMRGSCSKHSRAGA